MSRIMLTLMLLLIVGLVAAQSKDTYVLSREDYLDKSKKLKSTGYVFVTVGVAATVIGVIMSNSAETTDDPLSSLNKLPGQMLAVGGITTALCSIHFFSKAAKYDREAAALSFGNRNIISPIQPDFIAKSQPTITLNIKF
jgi:cytochrome c biogenesis factor